MAIRSVKHILPTQPIDMDGVPVLQAIPTAQVDQIDPFLLLHHLRLELHDDRPARIQGVGPHPHRGFSPVTFVLSGENRHQDSWGHNEVAKAGDVQWMNAGAGIIHSERPTEHSVQEGMTLEIVQLWINSPASEKMKQPYYKLLEGEQLPKFNQNGAEIKLVAGEYNGLKSPVQTSSELLVLWVKADSNASFEISIPINFNASAYLVNGDAKFPGFGLVDAKTLIHFGNDGESIGIVANSAQDILVIAGAPIAEKRVQQGPFVMNTETEILEAMRDYRMGKMGFLVESMD